MDKPIYVAVAVIITREGKILLGKRKNSYGAGSWGLPAGHLEHGETLIEGALRELKEETGVVASKEDLAFYTIVDAVREDNHYVHVAFELRKQVEVQLMEPEKCEGWEYFDRDELPDPIFVGNKGIIDAWLQGKMGYAQL